MRIGDSTKETTAAAEAAGKAAAKQETSKLGKDQFVQLLMAQLGNQDPTQPMDSQAFVAQLAQFSSLEQLSGVNERLESLLLAQASTSNTSAAAFVGREAAYRSDSVTVGSDGKVSTANAHLAAEAATVSVAVVDASGKPVRTIQMAGQQPGGFEVAWDGRDDAGNSVPAGKYKLRVTAADAKGKSVEVDMRGRGLVTGVSFEDGYPQLIIGGSRIQMSDVMEIQQRSGT